MDASAVRRAVDAGNAEWIEAFRAGDARRIAEIFDESGVMLRSLGSYARGREEIREALGQTMARFGPTETTLQTDDLWVVVDVAYETGRYRYSFTPPAGTPTALTGRYVVRWKRQTDGTWKIDMDLGLADE